MTMGLRYRIPLTLLLITLFSFFAVDIAYKGILSGRSFSPSSGEGGPAARGTPERVKPELEAFRVIWERNLFGTVEKKEDQRDIDVAELKPTRLNLALLGTVTDTGPGGFAVIEEKDGKKQDLYRVGDTVATAKIIRILRGMVVLRVGTQDEILSMEDEGLDRQGQEEGGTVPSQASVVSVKKSEIDGALSDMSKILMEARIRPYFTAGKADGFLVTRIKADSIFQKMGLENGDVIQGVNSQAIESPDRLLELYRGLKDGSEIVLNLKRRGKEETLRYVFRE